MTARSATYGISAWRLPSRRGVVAGHGVRYRPVAESSPADSPSVQNGAKGCVSSKRPRAANAFTNASWAESSAEPRSAVTAYATRQARTHSGRRARQAARRALTDQHDKLGVGASAHLCL